MKAEAEKQEPVVIYPSDYQTLRANNARHETNEKTLTRNVELLKKQVVDLQAQLLASQDRVSELQCKLLELRRIVNAPADPGLQPATG
jgi:predicted RNase H-like nuclease (RuvC/YqgF family)